MDSPLEGGLSTLAATFAALLIAIVAAVPARAAAPDADVAACALGRLPAELRTWLPRALADEQERYVESLRGTSRTARAREGRAFATGVAAYLYGMPPVLVRATIERFPANQFVGIAKLADRSVKTVIAPNNDTLYSVSRIDLSDGPVVIDAPATGGRYSVLQLIDAYSNVFGYVGAGPSRNAPDAVAVVPSDWDRPLPAGVRMVRSPTNEVWMIGRTLVNSEADVAPAAQVMRGYAITPLAERERSGPAVPLILDAFPAGQGPVELPRGLRFFDALADAQAANPPPRRDACAVRAFREAGLQPGSHPSMGLSGLSRRTLTAAERSGRRLLDRATVVVARASERAHNGWLFVADTGRLGTAYATRAVTANVAPAANVPAEALYPIADRDRRGRLLSGENDYIVSFPAGGLPPVRAFWSLTIYNRNRFFVPNPLDRYAIRSRTPGLRYGRGRSLDVYIQRRAPSGTRRANWLPAPAGRFSLYLRLYEPERSAIDGNWTPPTVKRIR